MNIIRKEIPAKIFLSAKKILTIPEISEFAEEVVERLYGEAEKLNLAITGPSEFIYSGCTDNVEDTFELRIAIPIEQEKDISVLFEYYRSPAFACLSQDYMGSMKGIKEGWASFHAAIKKNNYSPGLGDHEREVYKKWIDFDDPENITELQVEL